ncbi:hypothetical protein [Sporomusa acidovorans]|uniref:Uncharacterized protein n=1 Tax=Sporomusa acidovorans (strain ATCC 49682 / DSM 3132 / Mol) TaxID=1123286 RepID=A0ABZ3J5E0_SPOA4|nr:hypothetical protein [Sporomusa acidovorans]OZC15412.1 hypothetical protein SPACI_49620 [Sporomusa acidovorans DSM 3132]SDF13111.1 hypothetical protein SAMN04488499_103411 [Sporomusa acidovorans]
MDYLLAVGTCLAAIHAYTYSRWLKSNNYRTGAVGVVVLALAGMALSLYKLFFAQ